MIKIQKNVGRALYLFAQWSSLIDWNTSMNLTDVAIFSENIAKNLLNTVYDYELKNLNSEEKQNYPGIDLGDTNKGIAFQVTASYSKKKIIKNLASFESISKNKYPGGIRILILKRECPAPRKRTKNEFKAVCPIFDPDIHILTLKNLQQEITWLEDQGSPLFYEAITYMEKQFSDSPEIINLPSLDKKSIVCPFRGLKIFEEEHQEFFFGREEVVNQIKKRIRKTRFLAILGPSGCGKSSIVQAGLIPQFQKKSSIALLVPGQNPIVDLISALCKCFPENDKPNYKELTASIINRNTDISNLFREVLHKSGNKKLIIVVDQFEEIFKSFIEINNHKEFIDTLLNAALDSGLPISVILVMRSDFKANCDKYPELDKIIDENSFQVDPMNHINLRKAIVEPARKAGIKYQAGLVDKILEDSKGISVELPLIEYALLELFHKYINGEDVEINLKAYHDIGGIDGALIRRAEREYDELQEEEKDILQKIFVFRLIHLGEGIENTRRRAKKEEVLAIGGNSETAEKLLNHWTKETRLLTITQDMAQRHDVVDVAHEALIRKWGKIKTWMADRENRELARLFGTLSNEIWVWKNKGEKTIDLPQGGRLEDMKRVLVDYGAHLTVEESDFIKAGIKLQEEKEEAEEAARLIKLNREKRDKRIFFGIAFVLAVFAILFWIQKNRADVERIRADEQYVEAKCNRLALESSRILPTDNTSAIRISETVYRILPQKPSPIVLQELCSSAFSSRERPFYESIMPHSHLDSARFSTDGTRIITFSEKYSSVWDLKGKPLARRSNQRTFFLGPIFSPDGTKAISIFNENNLVIYKLKDNSPLKVIPHKYDISYAFFFPDSRRILTVSAKNKANICDVLGGSLSRLDRAPDSIENVFFSRTGHLFITAACDKSISLWKGTGHHIVDLKLNSHRIDKVIFSYDEKKIITITVDGKALVWTPKGKPFGKLNSQLGKTSNAEFSPHNDNIIATCQGETVKIWNLDNITLPTTLNHGASVQNLMFSPSKPQIITISDNKTVKLWELNGEFLSQFDHSTAVKGASFSHNGSMVLTWTEKTVKIWNLKGRLLAEYNGQQGIPSPSKEMFLILSKNHAKLINPTNKLLKITKLDMDIFFPSKAFISSKGTILISEENKVRMWNIDGGEIGSFPLESTVDKAAFSKDGCNISIMLFGDIAEGWEMDTNDRGNIYRKKIPKGVSDGNEMYLSRDSDEIIIVTKDRSIELWTHKSDQMRFGSLNNTISDLQNIVLSPDLDDQERVVLTISRQKQIEFWRLLWNLFAWLDKSNGSDSDAQFIAEVPKETVKLWDSQGNLLSTIDDYIEKVITARFSPDGTKILTASQGNSPKIWDLQGNLLAELNEQTTNVFDAIFSPSSTRILTLPKDKPPKLWDLKGHLLVVLETNSDKMQIEQNESSQILSAAFLCDHSDDDNQEADWIVTVSKDGTVKKWATPEKIINWLKDAPIPQLSEKEKKRLGIN